MDSEFVKAILAHNGAGPAEGEADDSEQESHFDTMADELIAAVHGKDKHSVKQLLRFLSEK